MSVLHNINRTDKDEPVYTPKDFMYDYIAVNDDNTTSKVRDNKIEDRKQPEKWEVMKQKSRMWAVATGSK